MNVRPYILAGGRSSRMGRDKAMLLLDGRTLLGRTVDTLKAVPSLKDSQGRVVVTILGERTELEGADRAIADPHPGCGPLGGIEAALRDLEQGGNSECAFFLPVDMPFLPAPLIDTLLREWSEAARRGAKICYVVVDGRPQPLVSMIHKAVLPYAADALTSGQLKVTPVLQSAAKVLVSSPVADIAYGRSLLHTTAVSLDRPGPAVAGWNVSGEQERLKRLWFSNLNNEKDLREAETLAAVLGSS